METPICINCLQCKTKKGVGVYCKEGMFKSKNMNDMILNTPFDFECVNFVEMDSHVYNSFGDSQRVCS